MVDRYDPEIDSETWIRSETGRVVFYSDYEALKDELSSAQEKILRLKAESDSLSELFDAAGQDNNILHEQIKALEADLERLSVKHKDSEAYYQEQIKEIESKNIELRNNLEEAHFEVLVLNEQLLNCREMYKRDCG